MHRHTQIILRTIASQLCVLICIRLCNKFFMNHRHMRNNRNDWLSIDIDRSVEEKFEKYHIQGVRKFKGKERKGEMTMMYKMI